MEEDAKSANPAAYVDEYNVHQLLKVRLRYEKSSSSILLYHTVFMYSVNYDQKAWTTCLTCVIKHIKS